MAAEYVVQENSDRLTLEDGSGFLLLEQQNDEADDDHFLACMGCGH